MEIDDDSLKRSLCSAQVARKIDNLVLQIEMKCSFIVLVFLKHIPVEMITALFKYFKRVEPTVSESAQASGLKEVEKDEVQKQLQSVKEPQPKKKTTL